MLALAIALAATLIIAYQTQAFVMGFGWAAIHGAGLVSLLALWPLLALEALLWAGFVLLRRRRTAVFAVYAVAVVIVGETVLPATPLKAARRHRALSRTEVRNVRDEAYRAPSGEPIGIRISFEAVFPERGTYLVAPTALSVTDATVPYELQFGSMVPSTPSPAPGHSAAGGLFDEGVVYTFSYGLLPNFIQYTAGKRPCIRTPARQGFSSQEFLDALARNRPAHYTTEIEVDDLEYGAARVAAASYVMVSTYDLQAIYQSVLGRGEGRCESGPTTVFR